MGVSSVGFYDCLDDGAPPGALWFEPEATIMAKLSPEWAEVKELVEIDGGEILCDGLSEPKGPTEEEVVVRKVARVVRWLPRSRRWLRLVDGLPMRLRTALEASRRMAEDSVGSTDTGPAKFVIEIRSGRGPDLLKSLSSGFGRDGYSVSELGADHAPTGDEFPLVTNFLKMLNRRAQLVWVTEPRGRVRRGVGQPGQSSTLTAGGEAEDRADALVLIGTLCSWVSMPSVLIAESRSLCWKTESLKWWKRYFSLNHMKGAGVKYPEGGRQMLEVLSNVEISEAGDVARPPWKTDEAGQFGTLPLDLVRLVVSRTAGWGDDGADLEEASPYELIKHEAGWNVPRRSRPFPLGSDPVWDQMGNLGGHLARATAASNALWRTSENPSKLLGFDLEGYRSPMKPLVPEDRPSALHSSAWRMMRDTLGPWSDFDRLESGHEGAVERVLSSDEGDEYLRPLGRLVEKDDFTALRTDLPDVTKESIMCDIIKDGPPELAELATPPLLEDPLTENETKAYVGVPNAEKGLLYRRMAQCGMVGWSGFVYIINGFFGVYKSFTPPKPIRMIIDARPCNRRLACPKYIAMMTPLGLAVSLRQIFRHLSLLQRLHARIYVAKRDVSCCFYRCLISPEWQKYLGLPSIVAKEVWSEVAGMTLEFRSRTGKVYRRVVRGTDRIFPVLRVVPMGLAHAVYMIQTFHLYICSKLVLLQTAAHLREGGLTESELSSKAAYSVIRR